MKEVIKGAPQVSFLGPIIYNLYFYNLQNTKFVHLKETNADWKTVEREMVSTE